MSSDQGLHAATGQEVSAEACDKYIGRWSRLVVPSLLAAAEVGSGAIACSTDEYWDAIEAGTGQMPLAYLTLSEGQRETVREEVRAALSPFMSEGRLEMSVEMLIGSGRA